MYLYVKSAILIFTSLLFLVNGGLRVRRIEENPSCDGLLGSHINLTNVGITTIRENFLASSLVTCLTLSNNQIWKIDKKAFKKLPILDYLDLAGNDLPQDAFDYDLSTVRTLVLDKAITRCRDGRQQYEKETQSCSSNNGYYGYDKVLNLLRFPILSTLPNLEKLYLRNNRIQSISWNRRMPNITHLYLEKNSINLNDLIRFIPPTLTHLFLSYNSINQFAHSPILLQLEELILESNQIRVLCYDYNCFEENRELPQDPEEPVKSHWEDSDPDKRAIQSHMDLRGATKLKKLSMASNLLQEIIDNSFVDLGSLQYLDLSNNLFQYIQRDAFKGAENLTTLLLSNNKLKRVPDLTYLENLEMLMLDRNGINVVESSSFLGLINLQILSLGNNSITDIDPTFLNVLPLLYELDLSRNQLTTLPADWLPLDTPLRRLHLDYNSFTNIESMSLNNATDLEYLNIARNPFQLLSVKSLIQLPENTVINAEVISFNGDRVQRSTDGVSRG